MYNQRLVDTTLLDWAQKKDHKPLLLRGARQVGKSCTIRHLGKQFDEFVEINFERNPQYKVLFDVDLDVRRICSQIANLCQKPLVPGKSLLFLDEIQECPKAIMSLRFFAEDYPELHVVAAGSLLEFSLEQLPTFGVGRIQSMYLYPMTFDEFLWATQQHGLIVERSHASITQPLSAVFHQRLIEQFRIYMLVGGMPEIVNKWVETQDFIQCQQLQDQLILSYEDDFPKYGKQIDLALLRMVWRSVAVQITHKFVYSKVSADIRADKIKQALEVLTMAGLVIPVTCTSANGLPLGSGADYNYRKYLVFDSGILLRLQHFSLGNMAQLSQTILTATAADLVNKGSLTEMVAGLEWLHYRPSDRRYELYYWTSDKKNSLAEIDYLDVQNANLLPIEIKAGTQGGMKSLWQFMHLKHISYALRCSLENFGSMDYFDDEENTQRRIDIVPLYALSQVCTM